MATAERKAKRIIQFGLDNNLEIVSYGLAPNPNGFCWESHGNASEEVLRAFSTMLTRADKETEKALRKIVFG